MPDRFTWCFVRSKSYFSCFPHVHLLSSAIVFLLRGWYSRISICNSMQHGVCNVTNEWLKHLYYSKNQIYYLQSSIWGSCQTLKKVFGYMLLWKYRCRFAILLINCSLFGSKFWSARKFLTECGAIRAPKIFARMGSIIQKGLSPTMLIRLLISEFDTFNVDTPLNVHAAMFALFLGSWKWKEMEWFLSWISSVFFGIPRFGFTHGMSVGLIYLLVRKFIPFLWSLLLYFVLCKYCLI